MEGDVSMDYARQLGQGLAEGRAITLPSTLQDVQPRARFVNEINDLLMGNDPAAALRALGRRVRYLAEVSGPVMLRSRTRSIGSRSRCDCGAGASPQRRPLPKQRSAA